MVQSTKNKIVNPIIRGTKEKSFSECLLLIRAKRNFIRQLFIQLIVVITKTKLFDDYISRKEKFETPGWQNESDFHLLIWLLSPHEGKYKVYFYFAINYTKVNEENRMLIYLRILMLHSNSVLPILRK